MIHSLRTFGKALAKTLEILDGSRTFWVLVGFNVGLVFAISPWGQWVVTH